MKYTPLIALIAGLLFTGCAQTPQATPAKTAVIPKGPTSRDVGNTAARVAMVPVGVVIGTATWPIALPMGAVVLATAEDESDRETAVMLLGWPVGCPFLFWQLDRSFNP